jgi:hypothetical protein
MLFWGAHTCLFNGSPRSPRPPERDISTGRGGGCWAIGLNWVSGSWSRRLSEQAAGADLSRITSATLAQVAAAAAGLLGQIGSLERCGLSEQAAGADLSRITKKNGIIPIKNRIPQIRTDKRCTIFGPIPNSLRPVFGPVSVYPGKNENGRKNTVYGCRRNGIYYHSKFGN